MSVSQPLKRILFTVSPELLKVIDFGRGQEERNPYIEGLLWEHPEVKRCAEEACIERQPRRKEGRLFASEIEDNLIWTTSTDLHSQSAQDQNSP